MEPYEYKQAVKVMEGWGYVHTADNHAKNVLFFLKHFENRSLHLHATVTLATHLIDLDTVGNLSLGVTLYCDSINIENVKFENFEKTLFNYLYLCKYAKPFHQVDSDRSGDESMEPQQNSKTLPGLGGVKTGEGKPAKPTIEERKKKFWDEVKGVAKQKGYPKELAVEFYTYWSEENKGRTAYRREKETHFEIPKRFATWIKNNKLWSNQTFVEKKIEKQEEQLKEKKQNLKHKDLF